MIRFFVVGLLSTLGGPVLAEHIDLDKLLMDVRESHGVERNLNSQREKRFLSAKESQALLLAESKAELKRQKAREAQLKARFEKNEIELGKLESVLKEKAGELGELFGVVRQVAADARSDMDSSLISAQFPGRIGKLQAISESSELPTVVQLENLWYLLQQEMTEQGKVVRFQGQVLSASGEPRKTDLVRVGPFNLFADGLYIRYLSETGTMLEFARQPEGKYLDMAEALEEDDSALVQVGIDPTGGVILGMLVKAPDVWERINQGGAVGYIILLLGGVGLIVVASRMVDLLRVAKGVEQQLADLARITDDNPLGRILGVARDSDVDDMESFELLIDEAVAKEIPVLEQGQSLIKLLAAVAPLLGLLGTVVGMIETFQSISLFGTGDPKLMAGGISQALVTTMLGLLVAIPLLFLHSLMLTRSNAISQVLDEQSAGLLCESMESRRT
ncbi:MAG: MotA/TolQ/ExbB proton channel family protein [Pseudomonadota bacterium]|jgi:biopolymer transport protein ExbB|nr:MotA/TolQ/ExbB proton channel family protein [Pseudomonadota bacterium]